MASDLTKNLMHMAAICGIIEVKLKHAKLVDRKVLVEINNARASLLKALQYLSDSEIEEISK